MSYLACTICAQPIPRGEVVHRGCHLFCSMRFQRIYMLYKREGKRLDRRSLHRAVRRWRQTPELDALYGET